MHPRALPAALFLFLLSGCSALIYELVWFQLLELVIGSSALSVGILLATFMGGMCLGGLFAPRLLSARLHPLRLYAFIELGIGLCGLLVLFGMPLLDRAYAAFSPGHGLPALVLRGAVCAITLLPPTFLMGATLPVAARWVESTPSGVAWLGFFYGANIAGAVCGCLLAGFYLLRVFDLTVATCLAAALNMLAALGAAALAKRAPAPPPASNRQTQRPPLAPGASAALTAIALSGLCALAAEVVWTRLLSLMLGATVYTFSLILAGYLFGLGLGSGLGAWLSKKLPRPVLALAVCQALLAAAIAGAACLLALWLPYWRMPAHAANPWPLFWRDALRSLCAVGTPALLWGASFPLAVAAVVRPGDDPGRLVGLVYAVNTAGAIVGAIGFSILAIPLAGTQLSQQILVALSALAALIACTPLLRVSKIRAAAALACGVALAYASLRFVPAPPWGVVAYGRQLPERTASARLLYLGEGATSSIAVTEHETARMFHTSGRIEASSNPQDMRVQRMLGHLPALLHPHPRSVLVVGCGAGVTAGSFALYPEIERITIVEIEPLVPQAARSYFATQNHGVLADPRTRLVHDDARHFILTTHDKFDIITSDPVHPWIKGSAALYSAEYFELCQRRLNAGGVVSQWVPLYESSSAAVKSEVATFFQVFPHSTLWTNDTLFGEGYDLVLLGRAHSAPIDVGKLQQRMDRPAYAPLVSVLREVGLGSAVGLLSAYAGRNPDLSPWLRDAQVNRDRNLRLQYLAGLGLNLRQADSIYNEILRHRQYPEDLVIATPALHRQLRKAMWLPPPAR
jgi:spermidine synthase